MSQDVLDKLADRLRYDCRDHEGIVRELKWLLNDFAWENELPTPYPEEEFDDEAE